MSKYHGFKINKGWKVLPQTAAINTLQTDVTAYTKNNIPWTAKNTDRLRKEIERFIKNVKIVALSCRDRDHDQDTQYGGALLATVGKQTGRVEHVLVISAYRV